MTLPARLAAATYLLKRLVLRGEVQRFAPAGVPELRPEAPPEQGVVDELSSYTLRGWARRLDDPDALVSVDVYLDGEFVGRAPCNRIRGDLAGLPNLNARGRHGFEFQLPEPVRRLGGRLRIVAALSGLELAGSPLDYDGTAPADAVVQIPELLSKVWHLGMLAGGPVSLAQIQHAYGARLRVLVQADPQAHDSGWPVTRAMSYANARNHGGRLPFHGATAYFELLMAAAVHFASTRAGLPMDAAQVEALTEPTGWLLAGQVKSTRILDAFATARGLDKGRAEACAAFLATFVVEVLARGRLPVELLRPDAWAFLQAGLPDGSGTRFESAFSDLAMFAETPRGPARITAVRLAAGDLGLEGLMRSEPSWSPPAAPSRPHGADGKQQGLRLIIGDYGDSGMSLNARNSLAALESIGLQTRVDAAPLSSPGSCESYAHLSDPLLPTLFLHLPPHDAVEVVLRLSPEQARARLIGFFWWETETLPDAHSLGAQLMDEIWVGSRYCQDIFQAAAPTTPVHMVGQAVRSAQPEAGFDARAWAGVKADDFVFLFHFDTHSWITRKNPTATVRAFREAFAPHETKVRLLVKVRRSEDWIFPQWRPWWEEFFEEAAADARIVIVREDLSRARMSSLTRAADAFISLHRSEGFGYGLAEAMLEGKPVIASAYSGNLDFTLPDEALLVPTPRRLIRSDEFLYPDRAQVWGEPDVAEAAAAMRRLHDDPALGWRLGASGRERIQAECSLDALAARYATLLQSWRASG